LPFGRTGPGTLTPATLLPMMRPSSKWMWMGCC